jgi:hypothetical protein
MAQAAHRIGGDEGVGELTLEARDLGTQRAPGSPLVSHEVRFADLKNDLRLPDFLV